MRCSGKLKKKKIKKFSCQGNISRKESVGVKCEKIKLQPKKTSEQNML